MRNGARGVIHPFRDRPDIGLPVRWYRVPFNNGPLQHPTIFDFDQWSGRDHLADQFPGFEQSYTYDLGVQTNELKGLGECGTDQQWLEGPLSTDGAPAIDPRTGQAVCCGPAVTLIAGGQAEGGVVVEPMPFMGVAGGQAEGGQALAGGLPIGLAGGQAEGGLAGIVAVAVQLAGGQAEGGEIDVFPVLSQIAGGQAEGGQVFGDQVVSMLEGGQAEGGDVFQLYYLVSGGQAEGGGLGPRQATASGGQAEGGTAIRIPFSVFAPAGGGALGGAVLVGP